MYGRSSFKATVTVDDNGTLWNARVTVNTGELEHEFEKSYAKTGWTIGEAGAEALLVVVDRVNRGSI